MTTRDTSADAMAAALAEQAAREAGEHDPPVALSGRDARTVRSAMLDAYELLTHLEERSKVFSQTQRLRRVRIVLGTALALVPEPRAAGGTATLETGAGALRR